MELDRASDPHIRRIVDEAVREAVAVTLRRLEAKKAEKKAKKAARRESFSAADVRRIVSDYLPPNRNGSARR